MGRLNLIFTSPLLPLVPSALGYCSKVRVAAQNSGPGAQACMLESGWFQALKEIIESSQEHRTLECTRDASLLLPLVNTHARRNTRALRTTSLPVSFLDKHALVLAHKLLTAKVLELHGIHDLAG